MVAQFEDVVALNIIREAVRAPAAQPFQWPSPLTDGQLRMVTGGLLPPALFSRLF